MKEAIILTKVEYENLMNRMTDLENTNAKQFRFCCNYAIDNARLHSRVKDLENQIWEMRNRADIDAFNKASDNEFYDWTNAMADKYNKNYDQQITKEIINEEKDWLKQVKRKYCKNYTEYMDQNGKFHIITFDEMETYKFCLQNLSPNKETERHGWDENCLASDAYYFRRLADEYKHAKDTEKNIYHHCLMMYYWCENIARKYADDPAEFKDWQKASQNWLREYHLILKYGRTYIY